jgi:protein-S-isoprenylcysteine O-methyltransferase Ste14
VDKVWNSRVVATLGFAVMAARGIAALRDQIAALPAHPGAADAALVGYSALYALVLVSFVVFVARRPPSRRAATDSAAYASCAVALASLLFLRSPSGSSGAWHVVAGDLVTLLGGAISLASILALGTCFGILPEVRGLVTRGPYRLARHPLYLGEITAVVGLVVASRSAWNLGVLAVFCAAQAVRIRLEERALAGELPEYAAYAARTPRIVPGAALVRRAFGGGRVPLRGVGLPGSP